MKERFNWATRLPQALFGCALALSPITSGQCKKDDCGALRRAREVLAGLARGGRIATKADGPGEPGSAKAHPGRRRRREAKSRVSACGEHQT